MLIMDRTNLFVPRYSHVLSTTDDVFELERLRRRVGAPPPALDRRNGRPHLDLRDGPRDLALADPEVRVFETTRELLRAWRAARQAVERS
jgi:hypothetical protein